MNHIGAHRHLLNTTPRNQVVVGIVVVGALLANIAGYSFDLYDRWGWFDKVLHAYTLFAITLVVGLWAYGRVLMGQHRHPLLLMVVIGSVGVGIGAWWEVAEWALDHLVVGNVIQGKWDTITDLIVDTVGAVAAGVVTVRMLKP